MITDKQYQYIVNKIPYVIKNDLINITKKEASRIIETNIVNNKPLLQWYVWLDKKLNRKYACTFKGNKQTYKETSDYIVYSKVFLKKRQAEEYYKQKLIFKTPRAIFKELL